MNYVDGFVLAVPKKNLEVYRRMSKAAGKVWMSKTLVHWFIDSLSH